MGKYMQDIKVSIIIISYNTWNYIEPCINSIYENCRDIEYEIIVVDNASSDRSVEQIRKAFPTVRLVENSQNLGFGKANNQAMELAKGRYLFLLNADTLIRSRNLNKILAYMDQHNVSILGPKLVAPDGKGQMTYNIYYGPTTPIRILFRLTFRLPGSGDRDVALLQKPTKVGFLVGAALFIDHKVAKEYGLFDESFFFTGEEADLCLRYNRHGLKVVYYPAFEIMHYVSSGDVHKCFHVLHYLKSLTVFIRKHAPRYYLLLRGLMVLYAVKNIIALQGRYILWRRVYHKKAARRYWLILQWMLFRISEAEMLESKYCK